MISAALGLQSSRPRAPPLVPRPDKDCLATGTNPDIITSSWETGVKLLRRHHWLSIWGLLALALQLALAGAHVHSHDDVLPSAIAGHSELADSASSAGQVPGSTQDEHRHASWPDCSTCWTQGLAGALLLPFIASVAPHFRIGKIAAGWQSGFPPVSIAPQGFQARAPPLH